MDNVLFARQLAPSSDVPEPAPFGLVAGALAGIAVTRRRMRTQ